jgi:hypothetical protein
MDSNAYHITFPFFKDLAYKREKKTNMAKSLKEERKRKG